MGKRQDALDEKMAKTTQSFGLPGKRDGSPVTDQ
jgi:hypothetical protein